MMTQWTETKQFEVAIEFRNMLGTHHINFVVTAFDATDACLKAGLRLAKRKYLFADDGIVLGIRTEEEYASG